MGKAAVKGFRCCALDSGFFHLTTGQFGIQLLLSLQKSLLNPKRPKPPKALTFWGSERVVRFSFREPENPISGARFLTPSCTL